MEANNEMNQKNVYLLLGISFVTQATTSLAGGLIGVGPFTATENMTETMNSVVSNLNGVYAGILLQIITAMVIIVLGAALYEAGSRANKTAAIIAMGFYFAEAIITFIDQILIFAITEVSRQYANSGDAALIGITKLLFASKDFTGSIAMIPFGLGALLFYGLILKANIIPKWLGFWGLITVPFILVGWILEAFGISVPFALYIPYMPWEWVAGIYILAKRKSLIINRQSYYSLTPYAVRYRSLYVKTK